MSVHYKLATFDCQNIFYLVRWQDYLIVRSLVCVALISLMFFKHTNMSVQQMVQLFCVTQI